MKTYLIRFSNTLLRPLLWCRQTLLDASEVCGTLDPAGYAGSWEGHRISRTLICKVGQMPVSPAPQKPQTHFLAGSHF